MRFIICLLIVVLFAGCEKYEMESSVLQQVSGVRPWQLKSYTITITPTPNESGTNIPDAGNKIIQISSSTNNYIGLGGWTLTGIRNGYWVIKSDTINLPPHRKYVLGDQWNFGNPNIYSLKIFDNLSNELGSCQVYENSSNSLFTSGNLIKIIENRVNPNSIPPVTDNGFVISTNARGVSYATSLELTTPNINSFVKDGERIIGRLSYSITLHFVRN